MIRNGDKRLPLFEIARVLVCVDHVASFIINANHTVMGAAEKFRVANRIADCIRLATGSSHNPKCQSGRIVAFPYIRLADPLERAPQSLADLRLRACHILPTPPHNPKLRSFRVNEASRHEHFSTPKVHARDKPGNLAVRPTTPLDTVISVPVEEPVAGPREPRCKLDGRLTLACDPLIRVERIDMDKHASRVDPRKLRLAVDSRYPVPSITRAVKPALAALRAAVLSESTSQKT